MDRSQLLNKIKEASPDGENFTLFISTVNHYSDQEVLKQAKFLESEMFISLREAQTAKVGSVEGVSLSGKIINL